MRDIVMFFVIAALYAFSNWSWYEIGRTEGRIEELRLLESILEQSIREMEDEHEQA